MKNLKLVLAFLITFLSLSFYAQNAVDSKSTPKLTFEKSSYDWGTVKEGELVEFDVEYTNTGKSDLVIESIEASCSCVTIKRNKNKAVKPGMKNSFHIVFDATAKKDLQQHVISIISNTSRGNERFIIQGTVKK